MSALTSPLTTAIAQSLQQVSDAPGEAGPPVFHPADLFVGAEPGAWLQYYLTPAQRASGLSGQAFRNAFPDAHLYQDQAAKTPVTALGHPIFVCVDQSQPFTELVGAWAKIAGDGAVVVNGDTITVTGGTDTMFLDFAVSPIGSVTNMQVEVVSGDPAVVGIWCGGEPEQMLSGRNYYTGRNPATGLNRMTFPAGQNFVVKVGPVRHSTAHTWSASGGAARPRYDVIGSGPALGAISDGVDDGGAGQNPVDFTSTDKVTVFVGSHISGVSGFGMQVAFNTTGIQTLGSFYQTYMPSLGIEAQAIPVGGSSIQGSFNAGVTLNTSDVFTAHFDMAGATPQDQIKLRVDEQVIAFNPSTPATVPGNFHNNLVWVFQNNGGNFLEGAISDLVVIGRATTPEETTDTESFINSNLGAY